MFCKRTITILLSNNVFQKTITILLSNNVFQTNHYEQYYYQTMFCKQTITNNNIVKQYFQKNHHNTIVKQCFPNKPLRTILLPNNVLQTNHHEQ